MLADELDLRNKQSAVSTRLFGGWRLATYDQPTGNCGIIYSVPLQVA